MNAYLEAVYCQKPCRCADCGGQRPGPCKYAEYDIGPTLTSLYATYVEHGNVPLTELPTWMADVGRRVHRYRNLGRRRRANDRFERNRSRKLLTKAGVM